MYKEYEVGLSLKSGQEIRVDVYGTIIYKTPGITFCIDKSHWILSGSEKLPPGDYKVSDRGTLVPYKPLPELNGGEIVEVTSKNGRSWLLYCKGKSKTLENTYIFSEEKSEQGDTFAIENIESITILQPVPEKQEKKERRHSREYC